MDDRKDAARVTVQRYKVSRLSLQKVAASLLPETATVGDLLGVDWGALAVEWPGSPSDWMNMRRAVSTFLSRHLGDKYHTFRRTVVQKIPTKRERKRVPDLTPAMFWKIMKHARADVRPVYVTLVATGMRVRTEFLQCDETNLLPATKQIRVPHDEKAGGRTVPVLPELWPWVVAAIPSPVQYKRLREIWIASCKKAGVTGLTLHDLRHCHGQWATDSGAALSDVQVSLGHTTLEMSSRYAAQKSAKRSAAGVAKALRRKGGR
jgi:integrase